MIHFDMQAPHGSRVYPTMTGIRIELSEDMRESVGKWLQDEATRFGQASTPSQEMMVCPKCGGKLQMRNDIPIFCSLCHGAMQVSKAVGEGYLKSLKQEQTIVRKQQPADLDGRQGTPPPQNHYDQLRQVINQQQHPVAIPLPHLQPKVAPPGEVLVVDGHELQPGEYTSKTELITEEDEFIGPIQQT